MTYRERTLAQEKQPTIPGWCNTVYRMQNLILAAAVIAIVIAVALNILFSKLQ